MLVPDSLEHVPAIPNQLPVEPLLAPNPPELDNDYLDVVDFDDEEEPYEDLDDEEEDLKENPEMDLDEEKEDPEMDIDDEEEEDPLPASPPPLPFKGPLSTYEVGEPSSVASASVFSARYELNYSTTSRQKLKNQVQSANIFATLVAMDRDRIEKTQDQNGKQIRELRHRLTSAEIRLEVASTDRYRLECELYNVRVQMHAIQQEMYWRGFEENRPTESIDLLATYGDADPPELQEPSDTIMPPKRMTAETTRVAATAGGAGGSNNTRPAAGAGGPNVVGLTVGAVVMNAVPEVTDYSYTEFMKCEPTKFKGTEGVVGLTRSFKRSESVFLISKCAKNDKVKYSTSTLLDEALSWWNSVAQPIGIENAYKILWVELKKIMIKQIGDTMSNHGSNHREVIGKVRIYQKSQENRQKRANTNTGNGRAQKMPRIQKQSQEKSTLSQLKSKKVSLGSNKVNSTKGQIPNVSFQSLQVSNVTQMVLEP
ncbi:hypothetical protein Tco_1107685 [Tanacetum coccineum]